LKKNITLLVEAALAHGCQKGKTLLIIVFMPTNDFLNIMALVINVAMVFLVAVSLFTQTEKAL